MLRLRHGHAIAWYNHNFTGTIKQVGGSAYIDSLDFTLFSTRQARRTRRGSKSTGDDTDKITVHRATHDIAQYRATAADQRTGNNEQIV